MNKTVVTIAKIVSAVIILLAILFLVLVIIHGKEGLIDNIILDYYTYLSYAALAIAGFLAIIFPIFFIVQNPKNALKIIIGLVVLVGIGFICYSIANNSFNLVDLERLETTAEISKRVGAALFFTYIVGGLAILSVLFSSIYNLFK